MTKQKRSVQVFEGNGRPTLGDKWWAVGKKLRELGISCLDCQGTGRIAIPFYGYKDCPTCTGQDS